MKFTYALLIVLLTAATVSAQAPLNPATRPAMPADHPPIARPTTQSAANGTLVIRVKQGTPGGPAIKAEPIKVLLYHPQKQEIIREEQIQLDEKGIIILENLPLFLPFQPFVNMTRGDVQFGAAGSLMDSQHPNQQLELTVYETTEQAPAWTVEMRHAILMPMPQGVQVKDVIKIANPSDRVWLGSKSADGHRETISLTIPGGAQNVEVSGLQGFAKTNDGRIVNTQPLMPGPATVTLLYFLPAQDGQVSFKATAPAPVQRMMLMSPANAAVLKVTGLESSGVSDLGRGPMAVYGANNLAAGSTVEVTAILPAAPAVTSDGSSVGKIILGVGTGLILIVGVAIVFLKSPKPVKK